MRGGYYCEKHQHLSKSDVLHFDFPYAKNRRISYHVDNIKAVKGKVDNENIEIYDSFIREDDVILFLVTKNDSLTPFWATEKQLNEKLILDFINDKIPYGKKKQLDTIRDKVQLYKAYCNNKCRTVGLYLSVYNCGIIVGYKEIFHSEGRNQTMAFILQIYGYLNKIPKFLAYDKGCCLFDFINRPSLNENEIGAIEQASSNQDDDENKEQFKYFNTERSNFIVNSKRAENLRDTTIVVDRFHFKSHTEAKCRRNCNPDHHVGLINTNLSVCEHTNYWFAGLKHFLKHMNYSHFHLTVYIASNEYNKAKLNNRFTAYDFD